MTMILQRVDSIAMIVASAIGGHENFFHCKKCGSCYSIGLQINHSCVENSMRHHCPICYEYLFDSLKDTTVMKCGHTMHCECLTEMLKRDKYCCPICSRSVIDMSRTWKRLDEEIEATIMPEDYRSKKVWIICNDCNDTTEVYFHIIGQKCCHCNSLHLTIGSPELCHSSAASPDHLHARPTLRSPISKRSHITGHDLSKTKKIVHNVTTRTLGRSAEDFRFELLLRPRCYQLILILLVYFIGHFWFIKYCTSFSEFSHGIRRPVRTTHLSKTKN